MQLLTGLEDGFEMEDEKKISMNLSKPILSDHQYLFWQAVPQLNYAPCEDANIHQYGGLSFL